MSKNSIYTIAGFLIILVGGGGFYGGTLYGKSQNIQPANGQFRMGQRATGQGTGNMARRGGSAGFVNGQVISKDDKSITVKSADGGSKIIFLSASTQVTKSASGTMNDLIDNTQVMVNGTTNPDGSVTASFIQIRPQISGAGPSGGAPGNPAAGGTMGQ
jgi:hypothetical protein